MSYDETSVGEGGPATVYDLLAASLVSAVNKDKSQKYIDIVLNFSKRGSIELNAFMQYQL